MKLSEVIELLNEDRLRDTRLRIRSWQDQREEATKRVAKAVRGEILMTEKAKLLEKNPDIDELEAQKLAAKSAKTNTRFLKNILGIIEGVIKKELR